MGYVRVILRASRAAVYMLMARNLDVVAMSRFGRLRGCAFLFAACSALVSRQCVLADTLALENGGQVEGQWLNRAEGSSASYHLQRNGVTIVVAGSQVREAVRQTPAESEYARRAPLAADTVAAQWELAEWCRSQVLMAQRGVHLRRLVELDPNHMRARQALGYQYLNGQWITKSDARRSEGYELYRGKWRTPQEIEILERRARNELAEKEWLGRLKKWRRELDDPDKHKLAYESLAGIRDPVAIGPLGQFFAGERTRAVKMLYTEVLAKFESPQAVKVLVDRALNDPDEEVFHYIIGTLSERQPPHVGDAFVQALADGNNVKVNRGATALARLNEKSAVSPLIEALITTHTSVVQNGLGAEATTSAFSSSGTFMKKGEGPELQVFHVKNQPALDALNKLTGADFGFDKRAWRTWYAQDKLAREASQPLLDARRQ